MQSDPELAPGPLMACEHCDTLYREPTLVRGEVSLCKRCGQVLQRGDVPNVDVTFALALTALIVFVFANLYPVVRVEVQGRHNEATVWQAVVALAHGYSLPMALVLGMTMIVVPALQIGLLTWISGFARTGKRAPGFKLGMRLLEQARPWSMVEVFLIGALVAVVKLAAFLEIKPGIGLFSLLLLTMLITLLAGRSTRGLWQMVATQADPPHHRLDAEPAA